MKAYLPSLLFVLLWLAYTVQFSFDRREAYVLPSKNDVEVSIPKIAVDASRDIFRLKVNELE